VQVNGKTKLVMPVLAGTGEQELERRLLADPELARLTGDREIVRMIIVPDRIVNIVTR
jgi:leucyl-tRNA synthetase